MTTLHDIELLTLLKQLNDLVRKLNELMDHELVKRKVVTGDGS